MFQVVYLPLSIARRRSQSLAQQIPLLLPRWIVYSSRVLDDVQFWCAGLHTPIRAASAPLLVDADRQDVFDYGVVVFRDTSSLSRVTAGVLVECAVA